MTSSCLPHTCTLGRRSPGLATGQVRHVRRTRERNPYALVTLHVAAPSCVWLVLASACHQLPLSILRLAALATQHAYFAHMPYMT